MCISLDCSSTYLDWWRCNEVVVVKGGVEFVYMLLMSSMTSLGIQGPL